MKQLPGKTGGNWVTRLCLAAHWMLSLPFGSLCVDTTSLLSPMLYHHGKPARWAEGAQSLSNEFKAGAGISALPALCPWLILSNIAPPSTIDSSPCPSWALEISCSDKLLCKVPGTLGDTVFRFAFSSLWIILCDWQFNCAPKWAISGSCSDMILQAEWLWLASESLWILLDPRAPWQTKPRIVILFRVLSDTDLHKDFLLLLSYGEAFGTKVSMKGREKALSLLLCVYG